MLKMAITRIRRTQKILGVRTLIQLEKPLIISEIGAGAIYGFRNTNRAKWTEDLQETILEEQIAAVLENPECSGVLIWQFADCRVDNGSFYARPKSK